MSERSYQEWRDSVHEYIHKNSTAREYIDEFTTMYGANAVFMELSDGGVMPIDSARIQKLSDKFLWFSEVGSCFRFEGKV